MRVISKTRRWRKKLSTYLKSTQKTVTRPRKYFILFYKKLKHMRAEKMADTCGLETFNFRRWVTPVLPLFLILSKFTHEQEYFDLKHDLEQISLDYLAGAKLTNSITTTLRSFYCKIHLYMQNVLFKKIMVASKSPNLFLEQKNFGGLHKKLVTDLCIHFLYFRTKKDFIN